MSDRDHQTRRSREGIPGRPPSDLQRDEHLAEAQRAAELGDAGRPLPAAAMLAVQRTAGNGAAARLTMPVQRASARGARKRFGRAYMGVVYGASARAAFEGIKYATAKKKAPPRKEETFDSELFARPATRTELGTVASIVLQTIKNATNRDHFNTKMVYDVKAADGTQVPDRLSLLYTELYMHLPARAAELQNAMQRAPYLDQSYNQGILDAARTKFQAKTAAPEEEKKSPMERIAEALEAMAAGRSSVAGKEPAPAPPPRKGAGGPKPPSPESILGQGAAWLFDEKDAVAAAPSSPGKGTRAQWPKGPSPETILGQGAAWLFDEGGQGPHGSSLAGALGGHRTRATPPATPPADTTTNTVAPTRPRAGGHRPPALDEQIQASLKLASNQELDAERSSPERKDADPAVGTPSVGDPGDTDTQQLLDETAGSV